MKTVKKKLGLLVRLGATAIALLIGQQALALGTDPGTAVTNTATVSYDVNSEPQAPIPSTAADFVVDRRVDFTVTRMGVALTPTGLGDTDGFLDFYVTNLSNGDLDLNLLFTQLADGGPDIYGAGTGDTTLPAEDMGNVRIRVSSALDPVGLPGTGPAPLLADPDSYIDNIPEDRSIRVRIYADTPAVSGNGEISGLSLDATAADPTGTVAAPGANLLETPGVDDPALVENVFADAGNDNSESDVDGFIIQAAQLTITKAAAVISDPFGSGKALPGAIIEYTITIDNSLGAVAATGISISDLVDADVTFIANAYNAGASNISFDGGASFCLADLADANGDGCTFDGTTLTIAGREMPPTVLTPIDVAATATVTVTFQVEIPAT